MADPCLQQHWIEFVELAAVYGSRDDAEIVVDVESADVFPFEGNDVVDVMFGACLNGHLLRVSVDCLDSCEIGPCWSSL